MNYYVYILESKDARFYTGYTTDIERRMKEHRSGVGSKFTRSFGVSNLLYYESYATKSEALKREAEIKSLSRTEKKMLMSNA